MLDHSRHELPNGMTVAHLDPIETAGLFQEIFIQDSYLRYGLSIGDGDIVFDVGANIGLFALRLAVRCPDVEIHMFEPAPAAREALQSNVREHGVRGKVYPFALSERDGEAEFIYYPHMSVMSGLHAEPTEDASLIRAYLANVVPDPAVLAERTARVPARFEDPIRAKVRVRSLSSVIDEEAIERIDLLKIDTEKSEHQVLAGLRPDHWEKVRQAVVEVHDDEGRLAWLTSEFRGRGFVVTAEQQPEWTDTSIWMLYARRPQ